MYWLQMVAYWSFINQIVSICIDTYIKRLHFKLSRLNCFSENPEFGGSVSSRTELDFGHVATRNENNKNRGCYFCKIQRIKTKSGWKTKSRFKCAKCNVILCIGERGSPRNCFHLYHEMLKNRIAYQWSLFIWFLLWSPVNQMLILFEIRPRHNMYNRCILCMYFKIV